MSTDTEKWTAVIGRRVRVMAAQLGVPPNRIRNSTGFRLDALILQASEKSV